VIDGTNSSSGATFRIGAETAADTSVTFANDHTTKPKIYVDDSNNSQLKGHRGDDEGAAGDFSIGCPILTTTERDNLTSPLNGMRIYNSTAGEVQHRVGGSWYTVSSGSTQPDASTTAAGKVELGTAAETIAGTATGGTGAALAITPDVLLGSSLSKTTSAGAGDSGKFLRLDANGVIDTSFVQTEPTKYIKFSDSLIRGETVNGATTPQAVAILREVRG